MILLLALNTILILFRSLLSLAKELEDISNKVQGSRDEYLDIMSSNT